MRARRMMTADDFTEHVARVRARFAAKLDGKIADSFAALEKMSGNGADAIEAAIVTHRCLHEMYGIAPTLGFAATGMAAGGARSAIREAAKARRAPTPEEIAALKSELEALRQAAAADLQKFSTGKTADAP
jgi:hypothetical protein